MAVTKDGIGAEPVVDGLVGHLESLAAAADRLFARARSLAAARLMPQGRISGEALDRDQHLAHGLAWFATYVMVLGQLARTAARLEAEGRFGEAERLTYQICAGEYVNQIAGGIPMNQGEWARPRELGLTASDLAPIEASPLFAAGNSAPARRRLVELLEAGAEAHAGLDPTLAEMAATMRRFVTDRIAPNAHAWHLANAYVPLEVIAELAELGVFALTLPEAHGGLGLSKESMCVVSEELSRGWIAVGSLGTRAEIACELILNGGTEAQKKHWLPRIASGEILPTAVFTEPDTGSDLGSLRTRAVRDGASYLVTGNKTWITHPVRADLMTLLARTDQGEAGYRGLSMFLAEKPRGDDANPFPAPGMSGTEIEVLGYRGMKEYEIRFESFAVKAENLLGGVEGQGFKQLMQTFESARIQTAARAVGVARNALDLGLAYARDRRQFGRNGFALEFEISRVLCDARILNIFEGAAEIQAQVIARRLLEGGN